MNTLRAIARAASDRLKHPAMMLAGLAAMMCSCSGHEDVPEPEMRQGTGLSIIIRAKGEDTRSGENGTWGGEYDGRMGTVAENTIAKESISLVIYDCTDGSVVDADTSAPGGTLEAFPIDSDMSAYRVLYHAGHVKFNDSHDYIAAIAVNTPHQPLNGLINSSFNFDVSLLNPEGGYEGALLPMFGFVRWNPKVLHSSETWNGQPTLGTISLLRSVCKVEVKLGDTSRASRLEFIDGEMPSFYMGGKLLNHTGTVAPDRSHWLDCAKAPHDITALDRDVTFNEYVSRPYCTTSDVVMTGISADRRSCYIYLPEAAGESVNGDEASPLRLNVPVQYTDGGVTRRITGTLFPSLPHTGGEDSKPVEGTDYTAWRLCRNHIYTFTITDFTDEQELTYKVGDTGSQTIYVPDYE